MKASFFKRMGAFILDYFIVIFIVSLITMGFSSNKTNDLTDKRDNKVQKKKKKKNKMTVNQNNG